MTDPTRRPGDPALCQAIFRMFRAYSHTTNRLDGPYLLRTMTETKECAGDPMKEVREAAEGSIETTAIDRILLQRVTVEDVRRANQWAFHERLRMGQCARDAMTWSSSFVFAGIMVTSTIRTVWRRMAGTGR
jgi:hypothetical protein